MRKKIRKYIFCKCGCGNKRLNYDNKGRKREYINGHHKFNKELSYNTKRKIGLALKGRKRKEIKREILIEKYFRQKKSLREISKENDISYSTLRRRFKEYGLNRRTPKELWRMDDYIKKLRNSLALKPNKPEKILIRLIKENNLPYKYVGDYKFIIDTKNPDFININGEKKVIEFFGNYWHNKKEENEYKKFYKKYGFGCLIIWENELKDKQKIINKIKDFELPQAEKDDGSLCALFSGTMEKSQESSKGGRNSSHN